jgi:hypothetical protein
MGLQDTMVSTIGVDPPLSKQTKGDFHCAGKSAASQEPADTMVSTIEVDPPFSKQTPGDCQSICWHCGCDVERKALHGWPRALPTTPFLGKEMEVDPQREKN